MSNVHKCYQDGLEVGKLVTQAFSFKTYFRTEIGPFTDVLQSDKYIWKKFLGVVAVTAKLFFQRSCSARPSHLTKFFQLAKLFVSRLVGELLFPDLHPFYPSPKHLVPYHGKCKRSNLASSLYISIYLRSTVLFCDGMRRLGTGNTKESNNKSTESSRTETESKAMRKRSKYFNVGVNETWAEGDSVAKQERSLQEPVRRM